MKIKSQNEATEIKTIIKVMLDDIIHRKVKQGFKIQKM
jgi:hypothetical protein